VNAGFLDVIHDPRPLPRSCVSLQRIDVDLDGVREVTVEQQRVLPRTVLIWPVLVFGVSEIESDGTTDAARVEQIVVERDLSWMIRSTQTPRQQGGRTTSGSTRSAAIRHRLFDRIGDPVLRLFKPSVASRAT